MSFTEIQRMLNVTGILFLVERRRIDGRIIRNDKSQINNLMFRIQDNIICIYSILQYISIQFNFNQFWVNNKLNFFLLILFILWSEALK